jgi:phosphoserine phosphatase
MIKLPVTFEANSHRLSRLVQPFALASAGKEVFLIDGDRTLSAQDTSRDLLSRAGIDHQPVKRRFQRDGYVFDAFRLHASTHLAIDEERFDALCHAVADETVLYTGAAAFVHDAARKGAAYIVSAGIPRIWTYVLARHGLVNVDVIGGIEPREPLVFGRSEKGLVASAFRDHAKTLVGIGDSDVDTEMLLQADHAVVVVNHHQNSDLIPSIAKHPSLWQVVPQGRPHHGVPQISFGEVSGISDRKTKPSTQAQICP